MPKSGKQKLARVQRDSNVGTIVDDSSGRSVIVL